MGGVELSGIVPVRTGPTRFPGYLPFASAANLGMRRDVFDALGGFEERFVGGAEDVDLCWRAQQAGHDLGFTSEAVVHDRERTKVRDIARQFRAYGAQDPHLYRIHGPRGMPPRVLGAGMRGWGHLLVQGPRYAMTAAGRSQWMRSAARRLGRIGGSLRHRTVSL